MEVSDSKFHFVHCLFPWSQNILKVCLMILQKIKKTWNVHSQTRTLLRIIFQFPNPTFFFLQKGCWKQSGLYLSVRRNRSDFIKFFLAAPVYALLISVTSHALHFYKEKDGNYSLLKERKKYFLADFCSLKSCQKTQSCPTKSNEGSPACLIEPRAKVKLTWVPRAGPPKATNSVRKVEWYVVLV